MQPFRRPPAFGKVVQYTPDRRGPLPGSVGNGNAGHVLEKKPSGPRLAYNSPEVRPQVTGIVFKHPLPGN